MYIKYHNSPLFTFILKNILFLYLLFLFLLKINLFPLFGLHIFQKPYLDYCKQCLFIQFQGISKI
jgi:hypothetical protein